MEGWGGGDKLQKKFHRFGIRNEIQQKKKQKKNCSLWNADGEGGGSVNYKRKFSSFWHQKQNPAKKFL